MNLLKDSKTNIFAKTTICRIVCHSFSVFLVVFMASCSKNTGESPEGLFEQARVEWQKGNKELGMSYLEKAADKGHPEAIMRVVDNLLSKNDPNPPDAKDAERAFQLLSKESMRENSDALYLLGSLYFMGFGTEQNFDKAADCFLKSADLGNPHAMGALGYQNGVRPNFERPLSEILRQRYEFAQQQKDLQK